MALCPVATFLLLIIIIFVNRFNDLRLLETSNRFVEASLSLILMYYPPFPEVCSVDTAKQQQKGYTASQWYI